MRVLQKKVLQELFQRHGVNPELKYKILQYNFNELELIVNVARDGYLYFANGYSKYWQARLDNQAIQIEKANINFQAIKLTPGEHYVRFIYHPSWIITSYYCYFLGFLLSILYMSYLVFRSRK